MIHAVADNHSTSLWTRELRTIRYDSSCTGGSTDTTENSSIRGGSYIMGVINITSAPCTYTTEVVNITKGTMVLRDAPTNEEVADDITPERRRLKGRDKWLMEHAGE